MNREKPSLTQLLTCILIISVIGMLISLLPASTVITKPVPRAYYGRTPEFGKWIATVVPAPNDANTIYSTATAADENEVFGFLYDITISAVGDDNDFTVILYNDIGRPIFSKTDCNTVTLPVTYALFQDDTDGTNHRGIANAGPLTIDTNDVDPNNLTSITVTVHKYEPRY